MNNNRALAVKQPPGIMLLDVLFNIPTAAKGIVGYIQCADPEHQHKHQYPQQGTAEEQPPIADKFW